MPLTPRVRQLIDTAEFRRLARISQLGLVAWSIRRPTTRGSSTRWASIGWRCCYLAAAGRRRAVRGGRRGRAGRRAVPRRGPAARPGPLAVLPSDRRHSPAGRARPRAVRQQLSARRRDRRRAARRLGHQPARRGRRCSRASRATAQSLVLRSMLSGPIDIDKMDYLIRDSLHAGVPYGRNFDQQRLIGSLCLNEAGDGLAITRQGEDRRRDDGLRPLRDVQRGLLAPRRALGHGHAAAGVFPAARPLDLDTLFRLTEQPMIDAMRTAAGDGPAGELLDGLFGPTRRLYKRLAQYSLFEEPQLYDRLARRPFPWLAACCGAVRRRGEHRAVDRWWRPHEILFDAPPVKLRGRVQHRRLLPQRTGLPPAGRRLARGADAGPRAVRRLRQARPDLRPPPPG